MTLSQLYYWDQDKMKWSFGTNMAGDLFSLSRGNIITAGEMFKVEETFYYWDVATNSTSKYFASYCDGPRLFGEVVDNYVILVSYISVIHSYCIKMIELGNGMFIKYDTSYYSPVHDPNCNIYNIFISNTSFYLCHSIYEFIDGGWMSVFVVNGSQDKISWVAKTNEGFLISILVYDKGITKNMLYDFDSNNSIIVPLNDFNQYDVEKTYYSKSYLIYYGTDFSYHLLQRAEFGRFKVIATLPVKQEIFCNFDRSTLNIVCLYKDKLVTYVIK